MQARSELGAARAQRITAGQAAIRAAARSSRRSRSRSSRRLTSTCGRSSGPMLESTCAAAPRGQPRRPPPALLKPGTRTILVADLRGLSPEDFAPIQRVPHNPVVIAIRDGASAGMVDALMLEGAIHALVDTPVESAAMLRAVNDAARISSTADALSAVTSAPRAAPVAKRSPACRMGVIAGIAVAVLAAGGGGWYFMKGSSTQAPAAARHAGRAGTATTRRGKAATGATAPAASLDEVLEKARLAMDERRYIEPAKNNALEHFRQVLVLDPKQRRSHRRPEAPRRPADRARPHRARRAPLRQRARRARGRAQHRPERPAPGRGRRASSTRCARRPRSRRSRRRSPRRTSIARRRCSKPRRRMRCCRPRRSRSSPRISTASAARRRSAAWWRAPKRVSRVAVS